MELKSSGERARALDKLLHEWVIRDAPAAARFVMELGSQHPLREDVIRCLVKFWALHDTPAVMAWASQLPDPSERKFALSQACMQMSERAPRSAIQEAIKYQLHEADNGLLENLTAQWATEDIPAAFDWVNQLPPGDLRDKLVLHIALVCSKIDPAEAARLVLNQIPPRRQPERGDYFRCLSMGRAGQGRGQRLGSAFPGGQPTTACDERDNDYRFLSTVTFFSVAAPRTRRLFASQ